MSVERTKDLYKIRKGVIQYWLTIFIRLTPERCKICIRFESNKFSVEICIELSEICARFAYDVYKICIKRLHEIRIRVKICGRLE